jgi:hypothetical protein
MYRGMPFVLRDAPWVFTQIMKKCVMAIREIWWIRCVIYFDDLKKIARQITQFLRYYGWTVNLEKSHLEQSQQFQYLELDNHDSSASFRKMSKSPKRIKNNKKRMSSGSIIMNSSH